jgi:hypothetical protein
MAATARIEEQKVKLKPAAQRMIEMRHAIHQQIDHRLDAEQGRTIKTESLDELRDGLRNYRRVALIGDPGAGKTTTLERLAYEYASAAAEETDEPYRQPLPLLARLGAYTGEDFAQFLEASFGGLQLRDYLPDRVVLLLDGLNEMPSAQHGRWAVPSQRGSTKPSCTISLSPIDDESMTPKKAMVHRCSAMSASPALASFPRTWPHSRYAQSTGSEPPSMNQRSAGSGSSENPQTATAAVAQMAPVASAAGRLLRRMSRLLRLTYVDAPVNLAQAEDIGEAKQCILKD